MRLTWLVLGVVLAAGALAFLNTEPDDEPLPAAPKAGAAKPPLQKHAAGSQGKKAILLDAATELAVERGLEYPIGFGDQALFFLFDGYAIPHTVVVDAAGMIRAVHRGPVSLEQLREDLGLGGEGAEDVEGAEGLEESERTGETEEAEEAEEAAGTTP